MKIELSHDQIDRLHALLSDEGILKDITEILEEAIADREYEVCIAYQDGSVEAVAVADERSCKETVKVMQMGQPAEWQRRYFYRVKE